MNVQKSSSLAALMVVARAVASPQRTDIIEQVLVKVNGEIITKTDLEARQIAALRQKNPNLRPDSDAALQKALAEVTPAVIVDAVDELLMVQRGKELGYTMTHRALQQHRREHQEGKQDRVATKRCRPRSSRKA